MYNWSEELVEKCPPDNAFAPNGLTFYRLAKSNPPTESDFVSYRKMRPNTKFHVSECVSRSLSIWGNKDYCLNLLKLPSHKDKTVMQLNLATGDGLVLQTGNDPSHYSWWRTKNYNVDSTPII